MATINLTPSGKYQVAIRIKGCRPEYRTFNSRQVAEEYAAIREDELRMDLVPLANELQATFSDAID